MTEGARGPRAERLDRSRARAWLVQIHYRWECDGGDRTLSDALHATRSTRRISPRRLPYIESVVELIDAHGPEIDARLRDALENWRLDRLSKIDRAVLRVAASEMLYREDVPPRVSIQEAIRLAEAYGGEESPRFVNGVLDALYKKLGP